MIRFLMGILFLLFTFHFATPIVALEFIQSKKAQRITENQFGDTQNRTTKYPEKSDVSDGGSQSPQDPQTTTGEFVLARNSINLSEETILGMDPTIALFVVFSVFLVLVVAIVALSQGGRPHD